MEIFLCRAQGLQQVSLSVANEAKPLSLNVERVALNIKEDSNAALESVAAEARQEAPQRLIVEIAGLKASAAPRFTYAVYLNLPEGDIDPEIKKIYRVKTLNLFGIADSHEHQDHHHGSEQGQTLRLDATTTVQYLRDAGLWKDETLTVTLVPVTPTATTEEEQQSLKDLLDKSATESKLSYGQINIKISRGQDEWFVV